MQQALLRAPFCLDPAALDWVYDTFEALTPRRRLAQLFNVVVMPQSPEDLAALADIQPGCVTQYLFGGAEAALATARDLARACAVPLLVSADVEGGAIGAACIGAAGGTPISNQLGLAAMDDAVLYRQAVEVMASEAAALGANWSFTPCVDINADFRSAIVGTRSFGSDARRIEQCGRINVQAIQAEGLAATAKHWPGEGHDARDQHLVTTINPLDMVQWHESYGRLYRALIAEGVMSIMSAHIALPAYAAQHRVTGLEACRPASISRLLNTGLLRGELGFNGVIVSDATVMAGLTSWGPRRQVLPEIIESGCDVILFTAVSGGSQADALDADLQILEAALADGRLSMQRVEQAVLRVLAMKAALGLHRHDAGRHDRSFDEIRALLGTPAHRSVGEQAASAGVTLVKDVHGLMPIDPVRHRRVVLVGDPAPAGFAMFEALPLQLGALLAQRGFEVRHHDPQHPPSSADTDLVLYVFAQESLAASSRIFLDWSRVLGGVPAAFDRPWHDLPCALISFGHPCYLYDAPRMPCVVNAYSAIEPVQRAVVRKLLGDEAFTGISPVDAFCGLPDAHY